MAITIGQSAYIAAFASYAVLALIYTGTRTMGLARLCLSVRNAAHSRLGGSRLGDAVADLPAAPGGPRSPCGFAVLDPVPLGLDRV